MKYYGYTQEQIDKIMSLLNKITVTGIAQIDSYHEATVTLRHPTEINVPEGEKTDGEEIRKA